jgi:UDP-N-acetylmuramate--alanine ligase
VSVTVSELGAVHIIGIGGAGMGVIAEVLHNLGYAVSGSDQSANRMTEQLARLAFHRRVERGGRMRKRVGSSRHH